MVSISKETTSIKLDKIKKDEAKKIFQTLGITMGEAFNIFLAQVVLNKGIPFEIRIPNKETNQAIVDAREKKNMTEVSFDELKQLADA